ncbi:hypothetical protein [Syntrophomonas wolfei]|uniref:hypothetical protein n=2 Tax=Syntrophomonas wolfei TaxID=863 RepID=UPI00077403A5|nr:hypothetical protein [Syntrophomonas wolfei]
MLYKCHVIVYVIILIFITIVLNIRRRCCHLPFLSQGIDINMDFDYDFKVRTNNRNKTGDKPFASPEARALRDLVIEEAPDIIIDFHGWINCASGDKEIADIFCQHLGLTYEPMEKAIYRGFFLDGQQKYARSVLVEYPDPITGQGACDLKSDQKYDYSQDKLDELQYSINTLKSIKDIIDHEL